MLYSNVNNVRWANQAQTIIDCEVEFEGIGLAPFSATQVDIHGHGSEIFGRAVAGEFGSIAPYEAPPGPDLDELVARKLDDINTAFSAAAGALLAGYPIEERLTWPTQQAEALAWLADSNAPTPYLDGLAVQRGITAQDMRERTLQAVQAWTAASQQLVGTRQALRDAVLAVEQAELSAEQARTALDAIQWPAS